MQLRYVFSELGQGLRRNLSMHLAVILTLFVSLTLVGIGVLLNQQATRAAEHWGNQLQITVYLCQAQRRQPGLPQRGDRGAEDGDRGRRRGQPRGRELPLRVQGGGVREGQGALRRRSSSTDQPRAHRRGHAAVDLDHAGGPRAVRGHQQRGRGPRRRLAASATCASTLKPIYATIDALKCGVALGTAAFLVLAALLLVANTIRLAAFARRKEIGIMRLVGASTLYIALPFLLEALVTAVIGVALADRGAGGVPALRRSSDAPAER